MADKKIITVFGEHESEKVIEKSRFLTFSAHTEGEDAAREFLAKIREKHPLSTHVCYAFIADKLGNLCRFSDDGEPQGTAGMPILEVLKNRTLHETTVAVVRYFGGIKLGAGGLVRAYASSAAEHLNGAKLASSELCSNWSLFVDYAGIDALQKYLSSRTCHVLSSDYGENVRFSVAVKKAEEQTFREELIDCMQGKIRAEKGAEYYSLFPL